MGTRRWLWPVVTAVLAVALVAIALVAVAERRDNRALQDRVDTLERRPSRPRSTTTTTVAPDDDDGSDDADDPLAGLGGGDAGGLFDPDVLNQCMPVLADALAGSAEGGLGGLLSGGGEAESLEEIATKVEQLRGLRFERRPEPKYLSQEELRERVVDDLAEQLPDERTEAEGRILAALGAIPRGGQLEDLLVQALGDQVGGFYDSETGELVVGGASGEQLPASSRVILAHELDHALTDQVLGLPVDDELPPPGEEDLSLARLSLVEGDATLLMQLYSLGSLSLLDQLSTLATAGPAREALKRLPHQLQRSLTFPYLDGLGFVCALHAEGGWAAVDRAYDEPPSTSAQVLFPDRYLSGEGALDPPDPGRPPQGWQQGLRQTLGAAQLLWLFEAPGGDTDKALSDAKERVEVWAGGELQAWTRGADTALGISLLERPDADGLCESVRTWARAAGLEAEVRCQDDSVQVGIAPDRETAAALAGG